MPATLDPTVTRTASEDSWAAWTTWDGSPSTGPHAAPSGWGTSATPGSQPDDQSGTRSGDQSGPRSASTIAGPYERGSQGRSVSVAGQLVEREVEANDKALVIAMHLWPAIAAILGPFGLAAPFIIWAIGRRRSAYLDDHGRAVMDSIFSYGIWFLVFGITFVGMAAWPIIAIVYLVGSVRGVMAATRNEYHRYPVCIDFTAKPGRAAIA